ICRGCASRATRRGAATSGNTCGSGSARAPTASPPRRACTRCRCRSMTDPAPRPFWRRPRARHLAHYRVRALGIAAWFALVYVGADRVTAQHAYRVRVHLDAELAVPFVPASVLGYLAMYPLFWLAPFVLHRGRELSALAVTLFSVIGVA